jgi:predicted NBD/HSP70 family sugar kinase
MKLDRSRPIIGSNAERTRLHNRQVVLGLVRRHQPVGRAAIARLSGLSIQGVSNIIAELTKQGFLSVAGRTMKGRGLPVVEYVLDREGVFALGIEVRPDAMFAALVNLMGETCFVERVSLSASTPEIVSDHALRLKQKALRQVGLHGSQLLGTGVVMPGPFGQIGLDDGGRSELEGWDDIDPVAHFEQVLETAVVVENDAAGAAVAERISGVAQNLKTYCYLYFGAGLGLGVVSDGEIMRGAFGNAGEIGHVVVRSGTRDDRLENFASRIAIRDQLAGAGLTVKTVDDLDRLHKQRNPHLLEWIQRAAPPLSQAIGIVENLFDPEAVILGGAMPDALLDDLIAALELPDVSVARREDRTLPRVLRGASGRMTAALGGAALVIHDISTPRIAAQS